MFGRIGRRGAVLLFGALVGACGAAPYPYDLNFNYGKYRFDLVDETVINKERSSVISQTLEVRSADRPGEVLFRENQPSWNVMREYPPLGTDLWGDGRSGFIAFGYAGGAHCCYDNRIFILGKELEVLKMDTGDSTLKFVDLDGRPGFEVERRDMAYIYWKTGFGSSPAPRVVYRYDKGRLVIATDLMRGPPLLPAEFEAKADEVRSSAIWGRDGPNMYDSDLWKVMLDLIYSGNMAQARAFGDRAWPVHIGGKDAFMKELFDCMLPRSRFWPYVAALNHLPLSKVGDWCPGRPDGG